MNKLLLACLSFVQFVTGVNHTGVGYRSSIFAPPPIAGNQGQQSLLW